MDAQSGHTDANASGPAPEPTSSSCRRKSDSTRYVDRLRDRMHGFMNASVDEHKACFYEVVQKLKAQSKELFGMSKIDGEQPSNPR